MNYKKDLSPLLSPNCIAVIGASEKFGAGSLVTKDIPDNVFAFGNPCEVQRKL